MFRAFNLLLFLAACTLAQAQFLNVVSATAQQVQLQFTLTPCDTTNVFTVERKILGGDYSTAGMGSACGFTDQTIDPYTTYLYRARANGTPSNEVTVGPPPYGFDLIVQAPAGLMHNEDFAGAQRMILDGNGDPMLSYVVYDPNVDGDYSDDTLYFVRWDRANYQWTTPVRIAVMGDVDKRIPIPQSIARDAGNNTIGIAFQDHTMVDAPRIRLAMSSDNGATWNIQTVASDGTQSNYAVPSLGLSKGNVHLAFYHDFDGIRYVTGKQSDDPAKWTSTLAPVLSGYSGVLPISHLTLDGNGDPAVAYILSGDNSAIAFLRPGKNATLAAAAPGYLGDEPDVKLSFFGTQPRIVVAGAMDDQFFSDFGHDVFVARSTDDGGTWLPVVPLSPDGERSMNGPLLIASGSLGQAVVVTESNSGSSGNVVCGLPKLSRSSDLLNWKTCGIANTVQSNFGAAYPVVGFAGNDKLFVSFQQAADTEGDILRGLYVWREPADWVFPPVPAPPQ